MWRCLSRTGVAGVLAVAVCALGVDRAGADGHNRIVATDIFGPQAGWALETDDAFVLTNAGCLEALTRRDADGALRPALAESWTRHSPTEWDFAIRPGVVFQDGTPLTAAVVSDALNALLAATAPPRAFSPKRVASVEAVGPMTVRIATPAPSVLLPARVAAPNTGILSPAAFAGATVDPVGHCTGPFEIVEYLPLQAVRLKRNDNYWGGPVSLEAGELRFIPEGSVRATQLRTGEAQISLRLPISEVIGLQSEPDIEVRSVAQARTTGLYINNAKAPLDDANVRRAIQHAIDTAAIAAAVYEGAARPAVGPFGPDDPWAPADAAAVPQDRTRARQYLTEAGVDPGSLDLVLLAYTERPELPDLAAVVQAQLGDIGIAVELKVANYATLEPDLMAGDFDMFLMSRGYLTDVADPIGFLTADYSCGGGFNLSQFCDSALDDKIDAAVATEDTQARHALYREIGGELHSRAVTVYVVHQQRNDGMAARVRNYRVHPDGHYLFTPDLALAPE